MSLDYIHLFLIKGSPCFNVECKCNRGSIWSYPFVIGEQTSDLESVSLP